MSVAQYLFRLPARLFGEEQVPSAIPPIPPEVTLAAEKRLGLLFTAETQELNLCLAQSEEHRPDFRTSFNAQELLQAIYALHNAAPIQPTTPNELHLSFPTNPDLFWNLVEYGKQLFTYHTLNFKLTEHQRSLFPLRAIDEPKPEQKLASVNFHPNPATPEKGRIWIHGKMFADGVTRASWECRINGKPPAKDYVSRHDENTFAPSQMLQYQQVLVALSETVLIRKAMQKLNIKEECLLIS